jgi:post-segregation antitoxin (ccd killing protein)
MIVARASVSLRVSESRSCALRLGRCEVVGGRLSNHSLRQSSWREEARDVIARDAPYIHRLGIPADEDERYEPMQQSESGLMIWTRFSRLVMEQGRL